MLNPRGVNVIRDFSAEGRGVRVWGARTMSSDPLWKYVNVRRLFIFVEKSIDEGHAVGRVRAEQRDHVGARPAPRQQLPASALAERRPGRHDEDEAFFVNCDRTTMTQDDIDNGRLICLIGMAPVKPAEFVIFRISQKTAEHSGRSRRTGPT